MSWQVVAGDVGGTKAHLAVFEVQDQADGPGPVLVKDKIYQSADYPGAGPVLEDFLSDADIDLPAAVCLGLPGPIQGDVCRTPNLPWVVDRRELAALDKVDRAVIINDLAAMAYGLSALNDEQLVELNPEAQAKPGNRALLAAGTGLGQAILFWDGQDWQPSASEGGHVDFAPRNEEEINLLRFLSQEFGHVSYERVVCGPGLYNVYRYLKQTGAYQELAAIGERITKEDTAAVIAKAALAGVCPLCSESLELFVRVYGAEAGNMALKALAVGGVYLGGGITPKILPALQKGAFLKAFKNKGRMLGLVESIPVKVILEPRTALFGAANYACRLPAS
ncbi:MAG: glucokinase [Deltaproteobacteria bacterium]|nr:glucokinase [Deltaproteobacteria bacterium]